MTWSIWRKDLRHICLIHRLFVTCRWSLSEGRDRTNVDGSHPHSHSGTDVKQLIRDPLYFSCSLPPSLSISVCLCLTRTRGHSIPLFVHNVSIATQERNKQTFSSHQLTLHASVDQEPAPPLDGAPCFFVLKYSRDKWYQKRKHDGRYNSPLLYSPTHLHLLSIPCFTSACRSIKPVH